MSMATSFFYIYVMATCFCYIYIDIYIDIAIYIDIYFDIYFDIYIYIDIYITFTNWRSVQSFYWTQFFIWPLLLYFYVLCETP